MTWLPIPFLFLAVAFSGIATYYLLKDGRKPYRTLAWLVFILFAPFLGAATFFYFGRNLRKRKIFDLKKEVDIRNYQEMLNRQAPVGEAKMADLGLEKYIDLVRIVRKTSLSPLTFDNEVRLLRGGEETFDAIFADCERARESILMEYYIYREGKLADRFADLFARKKKEGCRIILIIDGMGSASLSGAYEQKLREAGVEFGVFQPVRFGKLARMNYRNHRKILVIDGQIGYLGGINVDDKYVRGDERLGPWVDTHLRLEGSAVSFLETTVLSSWLFVHGENLLSTRSKALPSGNSPVQIVTSGPDSDFGSIQFSYLDLINQSDRSVYIANSYVVPSEAILKALIAGGLSGKDIRLIVPSNSDSVFVKWSMQSYFEELLRAGVRIFLFKAGFLHSKVLLVDDRVCSIGTANVDIRSFELNFEINALVFDPGLAKEVGELFAAYLAASEELLLEDFCRRANVEYAKEAIGRLVSPVM